MLYMYGFSIKCYCLSMWNHVAQSHSNEWWVSAYLLEAIYIRYKYLKRLIYTIHIALKLESDDNHDRNIQGNLGWEFSGILLTNWSQKPFQRSRGVVNPSLKSEMKYWSKGKLIALWVLDWISSLPRRFYSRGFSPVGEWLHLQICTS